MTHEQAIKRWRRLQAKLNKFRAARGIAEKEFELLKYGPQRVGDDHTPEWEEICKAAGISEHTDFTDLSF